MHCKCGTNIRVPRWISLKSCKQQGDQVLGMNQRVLFWPTVQKNVKTCQKFAFGIEPKATLHLYQPHFGRLHLYQPHFGRSKFLALIYPVGQSEIGNVEIEYRFLRPRGTVLFDIGRSTKRLFFRVIVRRHSKVSETIGWRPNHNPRYPSTEAFVFKSYSCYTDIKCSVKLTDSLCDNYFAI